MYCNFAKIHKTLRVIPAMAAGVETCVWSVEEIVGLLGQKGMRIAASLVALFTIVVGIGGLISPESGTEIRRLYFATPVRLYTAAAVRVAMGLVVILSAAASRAPKTLRALGAVMCMEGLAATLTGGLESRVSES